MSDSDFSDELLELAGATDKPSGHGGTTAEKKRKRRQQSSSSKPKRRKPDVESDSDDNGPESEEEDESGNVNPYPLEGKYVDEADRARLNQMSEVEREGIISQRLEEMQRIQDKRNLDQMLKAQKSGGGGGGGGDGGGGVSKSAKRAHPVRGATKEKTRKLDELRAKRKAKDERKRTKGSPKNGRDRSSSPMDMETSDEEEEEGMISKQDEEEERERRLLAKYTGTGANKGDVDDEEGNAVATIEDLEKVRLSRDLLAKHYLAPWFEDYVKGAWVRYLIGQDKEGRPTYRICEIQNLAADLVKPYKINDQTVNQHFELKHGGSVKDFPMDKTSNAKFDPREYDRIVRVYEAEKLKLPTKRQITKKVELMAKLVAQPMTEVRHRTFP
ncbi:hypothetical protein JAAARDRAFT_157870 [Jaapia argillacea MUCL 33604]|uniref:Plus3 domain-containing protein n=1 Tax=Jaapia argillacea MUCL 33604 TaxID=933084 RepID=A0A067Q267_9AGAM|nr:hypothetical protein JAAARDRAFT_157870 [Jaapia argillacea MUCL 33604]